MPFSFEQKQGWKKGRFWALFSLVWKSCRR